MGAAFIRTTAEMFACIIGMHLMPAVNVALPLVAMLVADCLAWAVPSRLGLFLPLWLGLRLARLGCASLA